MRVFELGEKVKIVGNDFWANNMTGIISFRPFTIEGEDDWEEGFHRNIQTRYGKIRYYWVKFDFLIVDNDGDGPYHEAEISSNYLIKL